VALVHFATGGPSSITAIAYCGDGPALTEVTAQIFTSGTASAQSVNATAMCPGRMQLMWGGMWGQFPSSSGAPEVLPFSMTAPSKTSWKVAGYNPTSQSGFLRALAYCR